MITVKRILLILLLTCSSLSITSCWDQIEPDQIALIMLMGIDTNPAGNGFEVTVHILNTAAGGKPSSGQSGSGSTSQTVTITSRGQTILDATRNLRGQIQGEFSFHHVRVILVGEDLARKGIDPVLDFIFRAPEIRLTDRLLICQGSARDIMVLAPKSAQTLDEEIRGIINNQEDWSKGYSPRVAEFYSGYLDQGIQPVAGRIGTEKLPVPLQPDGEGESPQGNNCTVVMEGAAVFRDDQLAGWLSGTETIGYRYITGEGGTALLIVPWHAALAVFQIQQDFSSLEYIAGSDPPQFRITMHLSGTLTEYTGTLDFTNQQLRELQALAADTLKDLLINTENKAKELNTDFLGYGAVISRQDPETWKTLNKKWRETFPAVRSQFSVQFDIKNTGPLISPPTR